MLASETLNLSIGDFVSDTRLTVSAVSGTAELFGKQVNFVLSADAVRAAADSDLPVLAEMELYFSCLVRKQLRFRNIQGVRADDMGIARLIPGFYTSFRAVTTAHCKRSEADTAAPVEEIAIKQPQRFVPDWIRIDFRNDRWLGEYGFTQTF